ncbi:MAG: glycerophosphodiester phosphodiesterase [Clostridia bacterium]|nr:glycerophosphodiester phosphodiesterase [Clostridia bacterium]
MSCKIIAHRGANRKAPQNTLPAFITAINEGTDGFETDVHLTKDGIPVICHNYTIDATSDGRGDITSYKLEELKKFDFGAYFSEEFKGTPLPTLDEFLDVTSKSNAEIINIELKCPRDNNISHLVEKTLESVKKYGCLDRVIISSFSPVVLSTVKEIDARCKTAFLYPISNPAVCRMVLYPFFMVKKIGCDIIHPANVAVSKRIVTIAHTLGIKVNVWTVNDKNTILKLLDMGVDGIITDKPLETKEIVEEYEKKKAKNV